MLVERDGLIYCIVNWMIDYPKDCSFEHGGEGKAKGKFEYSEMKKEFHSRCFRNQLMFKTLLL